MSDYCAYDDGQPYAATLGHFIGLLVDAGTDPAVIFRVIADEPPDKTGNFVRKIEIIVIPDGQVEKELVRRRVSHVHKTLQALIAAGVVK